MFIIHNLIGAGATATYTASNRLTTPINLFTNVVSSMVLPITSRSKTKSLLAPPTRNLILATLTFSAIICIAGTHFAPLLGMLLGHKYSSAGPVIALLMAGYGVGASAQVVTGWIYGSGIGVNRVPLFSALTTLLGLFVVVLGGLQRNLILASAGLLANQGTMFVLVTVLAIKTSSGLARSD